MEQSISPSTESQKDEESQKESSRIPRQFFSHRQSQPFNFWQGLQTAIATAFIVATLFTIWTPGSLVESSLEARMAQALESGEPESEGNLEGLQGTEVASPTAIGIVAGHYGSDPGAVCDSGVTEAELNLKIATMVQKKLTDLGFEVDLLQEFDPRLTGYFGQVLVSIHLDSCEYINDQATGYKVAPALSAQSLSASQRLTQCLSERYGEVTGLPYHAGSVTDDMTYYHAFNEIHPQTAAAIIEAGFMNMDYRLITEETDLIADGIVAGILCYLNKEAVNPTETP